MFLKLLTNRLGMNVFVTWECVISENISLKTDIEMDVTHDFNVCENCCGGKIHRNTCSYNIHRKTLFL